MATVSSLPQYQAIKGVFFVSIYSKASSIPLKIIVILGLYLFRFFFFNGGGTITLRSSAMDIISHGSLEVFLWKPTKDKKETSQDHVDPPYRVLHFTSNNVFRPPHFDRVSFFIGLSATTKSSFIFSESLKSYWSSFSFLFCSMCKSQLF